MRSVIILLFTVIFTAVYAQDNIKYNKDHSFIEAELKSRALQKVFQIKKDTAIEDGRGYDVNYYRLEMDIYPATFSMENRVTVKALSKMQNLTAVRLDFNSYLTVDSVNNAEGNLVWTHGNGSLVVTLAKAHDINESFTFTVFYHGRTDFAGQSVFGASFGHTQVFGRDHIWSLSESYGARDWWPCKDTPQDKADSVDLYYTVPNGMTAAGNGTLISETAENGRTTFHWKEKYPIATYLVSIAVYAYKRYEDSYVSQSGDTLPIMFFVAPENYSNSLNGFAKVKTMIGVYAGLFGEYPFIKEKYGQVEAAIGGGMEHQTLTTIGPIQYNGGIYTESLMAHELAHQWWGDMVTCASFHDIWLNEGFASYCEALWAEQQYGHENYKIYMAGFTYYGGGTIYVNDTTDAAAIFNSHLSYDKAAYVLHMLRGVVGDSTFFAIMKAWYANAATKYRSAYTKDFQKVCEQVSGIKLDKFFQEWIYGEYYPVYYYGFKTDKTGDGYNITVYLDQAGYSRPFWMPVDVRIFTSSDTLNFTVGDSLESQQFTFFSKNEPFKMVIDPDDWILKETHPKLIEPALDKGILVVNGMDWRRPGVFEAYENKAFRGNTPVTFWETQNEPDSGYPQSIPAIEGHGTLPLQKFGQYSTTIWLSSNTPTDLQIWKELPVIDYLHAGGNIILITQSGSFFIDDILKNYLGISWSEPDNVLVKNFLTTFKGLSDMDLSGSMAFISLFDTVLTKESSTLLYKTTEGFEEAKGAGVWSHPANGGHFVYLAARPWMFDYDQMRKNMTYILVHFADEAVVSVKDNPEPVLPEKFEISNIYPNPFNPSAQIEFTLPEQENVTIKIFDITGKEVAVLIKNRIFKAGTHTINWTASDLSSGIYFIRVEANKIQIVRKAILMK